MPEQRKCIVCCRPIPKRTHTFYFLRPRAAINGPHIKAAAIEEGHIDRGRFSTKIFTADPPTDRAGCARWSNMQVISHRIDKSTGRIEKFTAWDGESWQDKYFCTQYCASAQGYASAGKGTRFVWDQPVR